MAALHRLTADMAVELQESGVAVIAVWPPASTTDGMLAAQDLFDDITDWKPPLFTGRVVAALASSEHQLGVSGTALVIEDLACELGISHTST